MQHAKPQAPIALSADVAPSDAEAFIALKNLEERRKKKRRARTVRIALAVAVLALLAGAWFASSLLQPGEEGEEALPETAVVEREDFRSSVQSSGSLQAASSVLVTPEVEGVIDQVMVTEGQEVIEGDTLFTMHSAELEKAVAEAGEQVGAAEGEVSSAQATVNSLQKSYKKAKKAYKSEKAKAEKDAAKARKAGEAAKKKAYDKAVAAIPANATKDEVKKLKETAKEEAQSAYDAAYAAVPVTEVTPFDDAAYTEQIESAKAGVSSARSALAAAQRAYEQAVEEGGKCTVKAPQSGTLLAFSAVPGASVGEAAGAASSGSLAQIADLSQMKVSVEVNEIDISNISAGQRALVTFSALPDLELEGKVTDIASVATGGEEGGYGGGGIVTFAVNLVIKHPDPRLKPGMTASVDILTQDVKDALVVPVSALMDNGDGTAEAWVVTDEESFDAEPRTVVMGERSSSQVVIEKGLEEGEVVLLNGGVSDVDGEDTPDAEEALMDKA